MTAPQDRAERNRAIALAKGWTEYQDKWRNPVTGFWKVGLPDFHAHEWTARLQVEMGEDGVGMSIHFLGHEWVMECERITDAVAIEEWEGAGPTLADAVAQAWLAAQEEK